MLYEASDEGVNRVKPLNALGPLSLQQHSKFCFLQPSHLLCQVLFTIMKKIVQIYSFVLHGVLVPKDRLNKNFLSIFLLNHSSNVFKSRKIFDFLSCLLDGLQAMGCTCGHGALSCTDIAHRPLVQWCDFETIQHFHFLFSNLRIFCLPNHSSQSSDIVEKASIFC